MFTQCRAILPLLAICTCLSPVGLRSVRADDDLATTALSVAPQEVAFFSTSVNMKDAWTDLAEGDFVSRLRGVPFIQQLEVEFNKQWDDPQGQLAQAKAALENPNVKNIVNLLTDMMSDEVFVYGGEDWCDLIGGMMKLQNEMTAKMSEGPEAMEEFFRNLDKEDVDNIRIPTTVIGFRLSDDDNARLQLDALEGILRLGLGQIPEAQPFLRHLKRSDLSDGQTLTMSLDTSMVPLDAIDEDEREQAEQVLALLEGRSISMSIGVKSNILLMAFGEGETIINSVGEGDSKLLDHEKLAVLREAAPSRLRSIAYVSEEWRQAQWDANFDDYFQRMVGQFSAAINAEEDLPNLDDWQAEIKEDAKWMDQQLAAFAPNFGAMVSWSNATDGGSEGYMYDWTENTSFENAAPLSITDHAGEMPLALIGLKQKHIPEADEMLAYVLDKAPGHIKKFVSLVEDDEEERERVVKILDSAWPIVQDAFDILKDEIGPALSDNESLISVAGGWSTSTLGPDLPPPSKALPLPEISLACKLSDRDQFVAGCEHLYELFDRVVEMVRANDPDAIPADYTVPRPQSEEIEGGTRFFYTELSENVPLDGFAPQLIIGDEVIVLGYSDRQVRDMLTSRELQTRPAWMTPESPTAVVSYIDFAGMFASARPWIEFGLSTTGQPLSEPLSPQPGPIPTGNDVLQIWDCLVSAGKAASTLTVSDDGPTVTRWVWVGE